ncbi:MAG TPA: glycosyltransferase family A protein [Gaiellaceae bacterium]|nr:glycosyltransferase family A protein [Gaiellaceae bacterium]
MSTLSVVVPATDGPTTLRRAVAAIGNAQLPPEELIVVDRPRGLGPAAARNRGSQQARGEILVFVDADVEVHEDVFVRIRSVFDRDPDLAAVFGSYDDDPDVPGVVSAFRNLLHHHVHQQGAGVATTFWAGLGAIRRDVFEELGGFDEVRFSQPSVEDIELGSRLHASGRRVLLDPEIQGTHLKTWNLATMTKTDLLRRGVPWLRLMLEKRAGTGALNLGWRHRLSAAASVVLVVALIRRSHRWVLSTLALLLLVDRSFYGLLLRRRGLRLLVAGVPLHVIHRLTSVAAVPIALVAHAAETWKTRRVEP